MYLLSNVLLCTHQHIHNSTNLKKTQERRAIMKEVRNINGKKVCNLLDKKITL